MLNVALSPHFSLSDSSRLGPLIRDRDRLRAAEIATLLAAGVVAAIAVAMISPGLRIPGSAILRAALPMVCGIALVPRRFAGGVMAAGAALTASAFMAGGIGSLQPAALTALVALGPAIDLAMTAAPAPGWRLYLRFALAGVLANTVAFVARSGAAWLALDAARPHSVAQFGPGVFLSFAACGAIAGLLSAAACFRASARHR